jgi:DNA primase
LVTIAKPSIVLVLQALAPGIQLRRDVGGWTAVKCPWHGDREASASYNPDENRFRCHGCYVSGDGYDLIMQVDSCDFLTAKAKAELICGGNFTAPESSGSQGRSRLTAKRTETRSRLVRKRYERR